MDTQKKIESFFSQFRLIHYQSGETIFSAQDTPPGIFYIKKGFVRQYSISEQGVELTIHIYGPESHFPMMWGISNLPNRHHFQAVINTDVFLAPKDRVVEYFSTESEVAFEFYKRLLAGLDGLSRRLESITYGKAYHRVISVLIYLANHFGVKKGDKIHIRHRFTHNEIAALVGITREHVSLELEKLEKKNFIQFKDHSIVIPSITKLESELS